MEAVAYKDRHRVYGGWMLLLAENGYLIINKVKLLQDLALVPYLLNTTLGIICFLNWSI